ncbi:hypothetical protein D3C72_1750540 [compost metagenome]
MQVHAPQPRPAVLRHIGADVGPQVAVTHLDGRVLVQVLQHAGLPASSVVDVAVAAKATAFLFQLDQAQGRAAEQLGVVVTDRQEHVETAEQVLLAQLVAAVAVRNVLVGHVIAAGVIHLAGAQAPGAGLVDNLVQLGRVERRIQRAGFLDVVVGLPPGQANESVRGLGAGRSQCQGGGQCDSVQGKLHEVVLLVLVVAEHGT